MRRRSKRIDPECRVEREVARHKERQGESDSAPENVGASDRRSNRSHRARTKRPSCTGMKSPFAFCARRTP